jgi:hypothetical protein
MVWKTTICLALFLSSPIASGETTRDRAVSLKLSAFKDGFRLCSRKGPQNVTGSWELDQAEVERIDSALMKHIVRGGLKSRLALAPDGYVRQYLGLVSQGRRFVYVNAFGVRAGEDMAKARSELAVWCDGGSLFWGVEYDLRTRSFLNFATNSTLRRDPLEGLRM